MTECQSAITTAVSALDNLYAWEITLDTLLQPTGTAGSGTAASGAPQGNGADSLSGSGIPTRTGTHNGTGGHNGTLGQNGGTGTQSRVTGGSPSSGGTTRTLATSIAQGNVTGGSGASNLGSAEFDSGNGASGLSGVGNSSVGGGTDQVPTAADIASDQAQIDLMQTKLAIAQQNLKGATLTSPIDGTVADIAIAKGDRVSAASTSKVITIVGRSQYEIEVSIPLTEIDLIKAGQQATVTVDGISETLTGTVSRIGVLDNSSTSTPSYPVTVLLGSSDQTLFDGAGASLTIAVGSVDNVLTVPSSAVHTTGSRHTVTVLKDGATSEVSVHVGLIGPERTQITSGLKAGQVVVLANVDEPIPTTTANARFGGGNVGGFGLGGDQAPVRVGRFGR